MDNVKIRTSAFGGFNKNDVLAYIDALSKKAKTVEQKLEEKITTLSGSRENLASQVNEFSARIAELEDACSQAQQQVQQAKVESEAAKNEVSELRRKAGYLEVENSKLRSQINTVQASEKNLQEEKAKIADVIIDARKNAQLIMDSARDDAVMKIHEAEEEVNSLHNKVGSFIREVEGMKRSMAEMLRNVEGNVNEITLKLEELHKEVYRIDNSLKLISLDTGVSKFKLQKEDSSIDDIFSSDDSALG